MNKAISKYDINIHALEENIHSFDFEGEDDFFAALEQDIVNSGNFLANISIDKTANMMRLVFKIKANVKLICDRSLEEFVEEFNIIENYIYKFGPKAEIVTEELEIITFGTEKINVAHHIFDFISLQIPIKKLHPRFRDNQGDEDGIMVYQDSAESTPSEEPDPRWAALLKLKDLKE